MKRTFLVVFGIVIMAIIAIAGYALFESYNHIKEINEEVVGELYDYEVTRDTEGDMVYRGVYKYFVNDEPNYYTANTTYSPKQLVPKETKLYINQDGGVVSSEIPLEAWIFLSAFGFMGLYTVIMGVRSNEK